MNRSGKILLIGCLFILLAGCVADFFDIAWGTGIWLGELALTWAILFVVFCVFCLVFFVISARIIWQDTVFENVSNRIIFARQKLNWIRWLLVLGFFVFPIWLFQFSVLGIVFQGFYLRLSIWALQIFLLSILVTHKKDVLIDWNGFLYLLVLTAGGFSIMSSLKQVTNYPFSLGWSEGNRLWDYSILFGRARYDYPEDQEIEVFLDLGRQLVGGIPFLFSELTIKMERMWIGLTSILPYILLGIASFRFQIHEKRKWIALILWAYVFLKQGPVHSPLILCAALIMLAWRNRLWLSIPLVILATYAAYISRYTWTFAPGIWFFMLEFLDSQASGEGVFRLKSRIRSLLLVVLFCVIFVLVLFGVGAYFRTDLILHFYRTISELNITPGYILNKIQQQPLLWYRLLPNETYGSGVLVGLLFTVFPLAFVLFQLVKSKIWVLNSFQRWVIFLPVFAFFTVGIVVSVKIGGGGDLHNMDMFLISLFMLTVIAIHNKTDEISQFKSPPIILGLILLLVVPGIGPLMEMRSYSYYGSVSWLAALTDAPTERSLDMYPPKEVINRSLDTIQAEVDAAKISGDILFMDQRQLLTFGFVENVPLVPEYDKKTLIEQALIENPAYFEEFYDNLEKKRFTLIVTQPLNTPQKGSDSQFGEENDAWVKWVAAPLLCFYQVKQTMLDVNVQLLIPKLGVVNCAKFLP